MPNEFSYRRQIQAQYFYTGLAWLVSGSMSLIGTPICLVIDALSLLVALVLTLSLFRRNQEEADEMAESNINAAMAMSFVIGNLILIIISIVFGNIASSILDFSIDISRWLSPSILMFLGIEYVIVGIYFKKLEDN